MEMIFAQVLFWIGNISDWYTTKRILLDGGRGKELNPLMRWIVKVVGNGQIKIWKETFWHAELALLGLKVAVGVGFYLLAAPAIIWWTYGIVLCLVALSNKFGLLTKALKFFKKD